MNSNIFCSEDRIIYASSLAIYILNSDTYMVEKILCSNQKTITSISVCPLDRNLLAVGSTEGVITVWNIEEESVLRKIGVTFPVKVAWDPFSPRICHSLALDSVRLFSWDISSTDGNLSEMLKVKSDTLVGSIVRSNPKISGLIAIGCNLGTTILFQVSDKSTKLLSNADKKLAVEDMQWDRLSTSYLLIAFRTHIELWDTDATIMVHSFEKQPLPIRGIAWMDWTAGNFVSFNSKNNNLKVWNASQQHPIETIKIRGGGDGGLTAIAFNAAKKHAIFSCQDGSIVVFDILSARVVYRTPASHIETIFDCEFCPTNPFVFASCSYDSTVKLWNIHDLSLIRTMYSMEGIIYSVSWSPSGKFIAAGTSLGELIVWDTDSGHELARYKQSSKQLFRVHWNSFDERVLLNSTADGNAIVTEIDIDFIKDPANNPMLLGSRRRGTQSSSSSADQFSQPLNRRTIAHPGNVYGLAWSPFQATIFATCCQDGLVRIFNYAMMGELLFTLRGHNSRVFTVEWSPTSPGLLATASDDCTLMIWNINGKKAISGTQSSSAHGNSIDLVPINVLQGHTSNVRAICWSHELRHILLSGSWDSTIRVWNIDTGHCLAVIRDHNADVYAICSHRQMPFTFLSCSRDNTIRLWELGGMTKIMRYYAVWDGNFSRLFPKGGREKSENMIPESDAELSIFGHLRLSLMSNDITEFKAGESKEPGNMASDPRFMMHPTLLGGESSRLHRSLTEGETELKDLIGHQTSRDTDDNNGRVYRRGAARLEKNLPTDPLRMASIYYRLFTYFSGASGAMDLWENTVTILENQKTIRSSFFQAISSSGAWLRPTALRQVLHESELQGQSQLEARKLVSQSKVSLKKSESSGEENLIAAALAYMRMGEFAKYCQIMIDLGKWESALAVAPSVSLDYWRTLSQQYAMHLKDQSSEMAVPHLISIGRDADAVDYYIHRNDTQSAMTIAKMSEQRTDVIPDLILAGGEYGVSAGNGGDVLLTLPRGRYTNGNGQSNGSSTQGEMSSPVKGGLLRQSHHSSSLTSLDAINIGFSETSPVHQQTTARERTSKETEEARSLVRSVAYQASRRMMKLAQPILAAAHLLSVENIRGCIDVLMINHEPDLAYALAKCFKINTTKISLIWANECAAFGAIDLALEILEDVHLNQSQLATQQVPRSVPSTPQKPPIGGSSMAVVNPYNFAEEMALLVSKYAVNDQIVDELAQRHPLLRDFDRNSVLEKAKEDKAIGHDGDAITNYVIARSYVAAAVLGIHSCKPMLNDAFNLTSNGKRILHALQHVRAMDLDDRELRATFLCYMLWFSAHRAARKGAFHTAHTMLNVLLDYAPRTNPPFPIASSTIQYQMLFFMILAGDSTANSLLNTILSTELPSGQVRESLRALNALLKEEKGWNHWIQRLAAKWNRVSTVSVGHPAMSTFGSAAVSPRFAAKMPSSSTFDGMTTTPNSGGENMLSPNAKGGRLFHTSSFGETMMTSVMMNSMGANNLGSTVAQVDITLNLIVSVLGFEIYLLYLLNSFHYLRVLVYFLFVFLREIHKLTGALDLPSLTRLSRANAARSSSAAAAGTSNNNPSNNIDFILDLLLAPQPVIQGSLLPTSNQQLKSYKSCVDSLRRVHGQPYELEDHASYISVNEAANWLRFHGFSPLMNGEYLVPLS